MWRSSCLRRLKRCCSANYLSDSATCTGATTGRQMLCCAARIFTAAAQRLWDMRGALAWGHSTLRCVVTQAIAAGQRPPGPPDFTPHPHSPLKPHPNNHQPEHTSTAATLPTSCLGAAMHSRESTCCGRSATTQTCWRARRHKAAQIMETQQGALVCAVVCQRLCCHNSYLRWTACFHGARCQLCAAWLGCN